MNDSLFQFVRCPITKSSLSPAPQEMVDRLNGQIPQGSVRNRIGRTLQHALDGGLVNEDGSFLFPVQNGIPTLISDEAVPLDSAAIGQPKA